jgi:hypothetical protein
MRACLIAAFCLVPNLAIAANPSINVGVVDLVAPTADHLGAYPYVAVSVMIPTQRVTLVPTVGVEWSPELGAWGFSGCVVVDVPVAKRIGLDLIGSLIHDQSGTAFGDAAFYAGLGGGVSVFHETWTISPSVSVLRGLNVGGWTLAPAVNLAYAF